MFPPTIFSPNTPVGHHRRVIELARCALRRADLDSLGPVRVVWRCWGAMKGPRIALRVLCAGAIAAAGLALLPEAVSAGGTTLITASATDSFSQTFQYRIEVPDPWNGTLVLYSHGYSFGPSPATDVGDPTTGSWLLNHGYALAGSSYSTSGWALQQAFVDQIQTLDIFASDFRK